LRTVLAAALLACTAGAGARAEDAAPGLRAAATTGMVADLVRQVGGNRVEVVQLMEPGVDPHLYKPTAADAAELGRADVIFCSGLMLEGRMGDLFARLGRSGRKVYAITESVPEEQLLEPAEFEGHYDPHLWFDVGLWARTVPTIVEGLTAADPEGRDVYAANGAELARSLGELDAWCRALAESLPADRRILVTSHDAYNYFGRAYGFKVVGLQGVSTVSEAALADMAGLVDFIRQQQIKAIFVESSVNPAAIRRVAEDAGITIGGEIFSDALGNPGEIRGGHDVGTYGGMVRYNMETIVNALK
jgi:manganese/zinc/iron transport system substrate-binding protein